MWTDNETTDDLIGFRVHADLVRSVVTDPGVLPVTIGLFGDWGGGKTSIMKMLEADLDPQSRSDPEEKKRYERTACLYFNGWLFEGYDDAKSAILSAVLLALGEHKRFGPKVRDKAASLLKSVNLMRVARLGFKHVALPVAAAYVTGGASALPAALSGVGKVVGGWMGIGSPEDEPNAEKAGETTSVGGEDSASPKDPSAGNKDDQPDWESLIRNDTTPVGPLDVRTFRDRFAALLKDSDIDTLVVLIDDLDRCSPERIIENLEAIKLFLNVQRTAFVVGADPRIVRHAIAVRYKTGDVMEQAEGGSGEVEERLVTDYLEKLIQVPYWLPRLSPAEIETYMALLFCRRDLDADAWQTCLSACNAQRGENRYGTFGYGAVKAALGGGELSPVLTESLMFSASAAPLITEGLKGNPRQVKRFLNAFVLRKNLANIARLENVRDDVLVKLMILEYTDAKAFRELFQWQATQGGFPKEIRTLEEALRSDQPPPELVWKTEFQRRWIRMDPPLSEVDLRDYFWVARDRLESTFSGLSLIPPFVRRTLEDLLSENSGKRHAAAGRAKELSTAELASLLEAVRQQVLRQPERKQGYDALRLLVERDVPDALATLADAALAVPAESVPANVGLDLRTLASKKAATAERLDPVVANWEMTGEKTMVGRALKPRNRSRG